MMVVSILSKIACQYIITRISSNIAADAKITICTTTTITTTTTSRIPLPTLLPLLLDTSY